MGAENKEESCLPRNSAEHKGYVKTHCSFNRMRKSVIVADKCVLQ